MCAIQQGVRGTRRERGLFGLAAFGKAEPLRQRLWPHSQKELEEPSQQPALCLALIVFPPAFQKREGMGDTEKTLKIRKVAKGPS